jgi:hypothetical protein
MPLGSEATRALADGVVFENVAPDVIIELVLQGGVRIFLPAAEAIDRLGGAARRSLTRSDEIEVTESLPLDAAERGIADWAIEGLRLIGVDLPAMGSTAIAGHVDEKLVVTRLRSCRSDILLLGSDRRLTPDW